MSTPPEVRARLGADRTATLSRLASLEREQADIVAAAQSANGDDEHDPEGATIAFERSRVDALLRQAREHLAAIGRAEERVATGGYGSCERCGEPIGAERLAARPTTATCIRCAS
jgi:RNA polymerase-binding transcription factor DksA